MGFFSNFNGGDTRRDIRDGLRRGNRMLDQGRDTAQGYYDDAYDTSQGYLNPYIESGRKGQDFYDNLIGLNGHAARNQSQEFLQSDKAYQGQLGQEQNAMLRQMNARGMSGSGAGALAAERVFQQNYSNTLNRYQQRGQQGFQAAQAGANNANLYGNNSAQLQYGSAQQKAGNTMSAYNAIGQTRNTGMNNLLGLGGMAMKGFSAFNQPGRGGYGGGRY